MTVHITSLSYSNKLSTYATIHEFSTKIIVKYTIKLIDNIMTRYHNMNLNKTSQPMIAMRPNTTTVTSSSWTIISKSMNSNVKRLGSVVFFLAIQTMYLTRLSIHLLHINPEVREDLCEYLSFYITYNDILYYCILYAVSSSIVTPTKIT